jgi:DinB superfamily
MPTSVSEKTQIPDAIDARILSRILEEGYGPGAWHGNDMKAAVADVSAEDAFWRPQPERHDIAELALHHTYFVRQVRARLSAKEPEPFVLKGEDWFALPDERVMSWEDIRGLLDTEQRRLAELVSSLPTARQRSERDTTPFDLVLGITCHAVYHAAQIQLLKKLRGR